MESDRWSPTRDGQIEFSDYLLEYCENMFASYPDSRRTLANLYRRTAEFREMATGRSSRSIDDLHAVLKSEYTSEGTGFTELFRYVSALKQHLDSDKDN
jgi:hypothetical protein